ncbi:MAG: DUF2075 domain-containing protein [Actinomycetota bacterium]
MDFVADATHNRIAEKLRSAFFRFFRYEPSPSEVGSWQNSLRAMSDVIEVAALDDHGIVVELQLPLSSKRLDCMLTGHDAGERSQAVVVELKQWTNVEPSPIDDCVTVFIGGRKRDELHLSAQVEVGISATFWTFLRSTDGSIGLSSCAFAHNATHRPDDELWSSSHDQLLARWPLFAGNQVDGFASFLDEQLSGGDGRVVLEQVLKGKYRPHKRLLEHTARVIRREPTYVLLDEQQVVFNHILGRVRDRQASSDQSVFLIRGGPGTGKSVLAVNLLAELSADGFVTQHATGSKAFTGNLRKTVGTRARAQFNFFNSFAGAEPQVLDAIICDEAHRIRGTSGSRFQKKEDRSGLPQIDELIGSAKVSVFFIDDLQVVRPGEVGSSALIRDSAARAGIPVYEHELETQFRCGGSDAFVGWIDNTLEIHPTPFVLWEPGEEFDFQIVDSPSELDMMIRTRAEEGHTARLTAGFCWPWSEPLADGSLIRDVRIGDWAAPWNAKDHAGRLGPGIPKANYWASDPAGIEQVGCVYTAQGFEFDYVGVIFGRDLVWRSREQWVGHPEASYDTQVKRGATKDQERFTELVKHTYRVLLTRGLLGCYVYFEDDATRDFFLSRVDWHEE